MISSTSRIVLRRNETITLVTPQIRRGSPNLTEVIWYVKGKTIVTRINTATTRSELVLEPTLQQDSITCTLENELGRTSFVFLLEFVTVPQWITELKGHIEVELGSNMTLTIQVLSNTQCDIQWSHDMKLLSKHSLESKSIGQIHMQTLMIWNISWADAGFYSVNVTNVVGSIQSGVQVKVKSSSLINPNDRETKLF